MAHYKMGVALKESDIVTNDPFFGLAQKYINSDYYTVKANVLIQLTNLATQLEKYLKVN